MANYKIVRTAKARQIADVIRRAGSYPWVGLYEVDEGEIAAIAWRGIDAPALPRFPISQGLSGAAVRSGSPVVVGDVTKDPRYLTAFGSTLSEAIIPVHREPKVIGTIDVESGSLNAFSESDVAFLEKCADAVRQLWS